ncbi:CUE domain-containing [Lecanosticta acicola]|uniref:RNA polymerase II degradation factor 1 n=1 Tax=Lecanosticta acicola TaxID=111012 RepID=A0AAI8YSC8_9PEZI|nr:CUE domain-containing [Lecanosticta acicola]
MSEADVRPVPARGRSTTRGGRGGFGRGGPRGGRKVNGTSTDPASVEESLEEQGELGEMKKKYANELDMLRDMFPDWTDTDLVFALQEADGDVAATVDKITQGAVSQFAEVKKPKDRARSKAKEEPAAAGAADKPAFAARGGRGRGGFEGLRGGRGRGSDRGRGGHRGGRGGHATANGTIKEGHTDSVPTTESTAWDTSANNTAGDGAWGTATTAAEGGWDNSADATKDAADAGQSAWGNVIAAESTPAAASEGAKSSLIPEGGPKKSWASMFAKPKPAPAPVPQKQILTKQQPPPAELVASGHLPPAAEPTPSAVEETKEAETLPPAPPIPEPEQPIATPADAPVERPLTSEGEELTLTPSKDPLTEENVEHLPDESHPPATHTVASTTGSIDPRNLTPLPSQPAPIGRPPMGGFATSANRLAGTGGRSASFQRRVLEQQEAVVMPGHNALDRAAVQFGSMGLNGEPGPDVDEEREEPETRLPPQHSPPSQPRTSLPPAPRQTVAPQELSGEAAVPTPKQAPGLPPASAQNQQQMLQEASLGQNLAQEQQVSQPYSQYGRYGQQDSGAQQKPYDHFGHQAQHSQYDQFGGHAPQQPQQQAPAGFGGLSSAPSDYSSYYTSDQSRAYNQYYGSSFGLHDGRGQLGQSQAQQDNSAGPQRSASGFGPMPHDASSAFASQAPQPAQSRFAEAPGSGQNTPNPPIGGQQQSAQQVNAQHSQHSMHQPQGHQQGGYSAAAAAAAAAAGFPYGHPYYNSPYQQAYQNQFGYTPQAGGYGGAGYPGKQGSMYGGPHGYGLGSQSSYDQHSSSPSNAGAFGQNQQSSMRSTSGMGSGLGGLDDYNRGSQAGSHQQSGGFGAMNDPFARSTSGLGSQGYGQQSMTTGPDDALKPFNDSKSGPSPALGQPGRPGSEANNAAGNTQTGLPPPQNQNSAFGGYPGFPGQGSQYGGLGGLGSHQQGHGGMGGQSAYGGYGGFNQTYGGYGASRGWGANYGGH